MREQDLITALDGLDHRICLYREELLREAIRQKLTPEETLQRYSSIFSEKWLRSIDPVSLIDPTEAHPTGGFDRNGKEKSFVQGMYQYFNRIKLYLADETMYEQHPHHQLRIMVEKAVKLNKELLGLLGIDHATVEEYPLGEIPPGPDEPGLIVVLCPLCRGRIKATDVDPQAIVYPTDEATVQKILDGTFNTVVCDRCWINIHFGFLFSTGDFTCVELKAIEEPPRTLEDAVSNLRTYSYLKRNAEAANVAEAYGLKDLKLGERGGLVPWDIMLAGCALDAIGKKEESLLYFERAAELEPANGQIFRALVLWHVRARDLDKAEYYLKKMLGEKIGVSDMLVDNLHFRLETMRMLKSLYELAHKGTEAKKCQGDIDEMLREHHFLR